MRIELVSTPIVALATTTSTLLLGGSAWLALGVFFATPFVFLTLLWLIPNLRRSLPLRGKKVHDVGGVKPARQRGDMARLKASAQGANHKNG